MIPWLNDDDHERLWRICDALVTQGGARAAILCDAENGSVVISVGETGASGSVSSVEALAPGERLIHGAAGEIYGVDVPGGGLLAVLHERPALEKVRAAAAEAVRNMAHLLTSLPETGRDVHVHDHVHVHVEPEAKAKTKARTKKRTRTTPRPKTRTGTTPRPKARTGTRRKPQAKKKGRTKPGRPAAKKPKKRR